MMSTDIAFPHVTVPAAASLPPVAAPRATDALLSASRRIDWRFLLPEPDLSQVMYVGPTRGALVESLRLFCTSLCVIGDVREIEKHAVRYPVVVASDPCYAVLERIAERVSPGGWLYVEARRRKRRSCGRSDSKARPLRHAPDYAAAIQRLGFDEVEAHWHWPDLETCAEMVRLGAREAVRHSLKRRTSGPAARLKATLAGGLLRIGLLDRFVPWFSVVGRKR